MDLAANLFGDQGGRNPAAGLQRNPLEQWFFDLPPITRTYTFLVSLTSVLIQCQILTPFNLFYTFRSAFSKGQYWRPITTFLYFGPLSLDLIFHVFFLQRYARLLEENESSTAKFSWLVLLASSGFLVLSPLFSLPFLGTAMSQALVYVWARRNPDVRLSFLGLMVFSAPWLPWVLMGFTFVMHGVVPKDEICGVVIGHLWYFFTDIYPPLHGGYRPLEPPTWWMRLWHGGQDQQQGEVRDGTAVDGDLAARGVPAPAPQIQ